VDDKVRSVKATITCSIKLIAAQFRDLTTSGILSRKLCLTSRLLGCKSKSEIPGWKYGRKRNIKRLELRSYRRLDPFFEEGAFEYTCHVAAMPFGITIRALIGILVTSAALEAYGNVRGIL
jgi:hypothetical protein